MSAAARNARPSTTATKETKKMTRRLGPLAGLLALAALLLAAVAPAAQAAPLWVIHAANNTAVEPGGQVAFHVDAQNFGDSFTNGTYKVTATLPPGLTAISAEGEGGFPFSCPTLSAGLVECESSEGLSPGNPAKLIVRAQAPASEGTLTAHFSVEGGEVPAASSTVAPVRVSSAPPTFDVAAFDTLAAAEEAGTPLWQAGAHPDSYRTFLKVASHTDPDLGDPAGNTEAVEPLKDAIVELPPGLVGDPTSLEECTLIELSNSEGANPKPLCASVSQLGTATVLLNGYPLFHTSRAPIYNLVPPPGVAARFGFIVSGVVVVIDATLRSSDYRLIAASRNTSLGLPVFGAELSFWGVPSSSTHDSERFCPGQGTSYESPRCTSGAPARPFFRMPTSCEGPLSSSVHASSWFNPGAVDQEGEPLLSDPAWKSAASASHELPGYPYPPSEWGAPAGMQGCEKVPVKAEFSAQATALDAESSSGLAVRLEAPNPGLENPTGIASSDFKEVKVVLPQGMTINPSQAEGLGVCSSARYGSTRLESHPDGQHGCPADSKIGAVEVKSPLLEETLPGEVYVAAPHDNPFDSLLAIYVVIAEPQRGILIKLPGEVRLNETTGRIETEFSDLPQVPFESFDFRFREGARAPLITPPRCGTYETEATFTPWSDPANPIVRTSSFEVTRGIGGGPCPSGAPGFNPGFSAGSVNNNAGSFSEFVMRLTRNDGEQDMTKFSSILPPGVSAKIAGVGKCPEAAIAGAEGKTGLQERANPSCPASSQIGRSLVGAGVGSVLTYVPGQLYLAGPYNGAPLSVVSITPAVAGPFDIGTVVVREALSLDPVTAEVHVDGDRSDPIPHILKGIPLKLRDLRVYVDRDRFTINPTSCDPSSVKATLFGSGLDVFNPADDQPVSLSSRYQAASCASLGFKPKLKIRLRGGTKLGAHPGLRAVVTPRKGDANIDGAAVTLPRSAFLEQAHIRTICTRVQFAANSCPPAAIYGKVTAWTPLLDEPLSGPVYLRSSTNKLPDLVFDLHGVVDIEVPGRIDSVNGGIRATFANVPDAPISKVVLAMQGGKKGLIVNSANLCAAKRRAKALFSGQNGKERRFRPVVGAQCGKKQRRGGKRK